VAVEAPVSILETHGLSKRFGGVHVARDIDFRLEASETPA
jgi:ABC-type branched-subunit amino acid transport system ATPase component